MSIKTAIKSVLNLLVVNIQLIIAIYEKKCYNLLNRFFSKIAISICTLFVLPAKISELDLKY